MDRREIHVSASYGIFVRNQNKVRLYFMFITDYSNNKFYFYVNFKLKEYSFKKKNFKKNIHIIKYSVYSILSEYTRITSGKISEEQIRFRPGRCHFFVLKQMMRRGRYFSLETDIAFIDFQKVEIDIDKAWIKMLW